MGKRRACKEIADLGVEHHDAHSPHESTKHDSINTCQRKKIPSYIFVGSRIRAEDLERVGTLHLLDPCLM